MLKNQWGRYMQSHELMPVLGYNRGAHLPKEGWVERSVRYERQSVIMRCLPASTGRRHRIEFLCTCEQWIPFGRAGQHMKGQNHHRKINEILTSVHSTKESA